MLIVTALGLAGAAVSAYVWYKQVTSGPVLCIGTGCAKVIRSPYGRLLGIPNGALGIAYFTTAAVVPLIAGALPLARSSLVAVSAVALALYAYLTYLQAAVLHAWCVWCLGSAVLTAALLAAALLAP
jgi:uncharacterized membrane protein